MNTRKPISHCMNLPTEPPEISNYGLRCWSRSGASSFESPTLVRQRTIKRDKNPDYPFTSTTKFNLVQTGPT